MIRSGILGATGLAALALTGLGTAAPPAGPKFDREGAVYTETNSVAGNAIAVYVQARGGGLIPAGTVPTGGLGTGAPLGSQGSVILDKDGSQLFAVNAGDNTISAFDVGPRGLTLQNVVPSGGTTPISLTVHQDTLYVLNAGSAANISGFRVDRRDGLAPLAGSTQPLGTGASSPEQIGFGRHGHVLVVSEKGSDTIDTFQVGDDDLAGPAQSHASAGSGPYGFDFGKKGNLIISDAASAAASSYSLSRDGDLDLIAGPVATNGQAAPCWLVVSDDGRFAYTANAGSGTVSGYSVDHGELTLLDPSGVTASLGAGSHPLDEAMSTRGGSYFYILADGIHMLNTYRQNRDGSLTFVSAVPGLPVGDAGLATR